MTAAGAIPARPVPIRVAVFVDGQNLYHRCRDHFGWPWVHPRKLAQALLALAERISRNFDAVVDEIGKRILAEFPYRGRRGGPHRHRTDQAVTWTVTFRLLKRVPVRRLHG